MTTTHALTAKANSALADFDARDFRYVAGGIEAARGRVNMALTYLPNA